ncbi:hypothetical protein [Streptomyces sp. NPDC019890]|uniref:hypothetical protein n=1 Tax=Streptomyces sp. NPDC019890 TaxID=3365064 RepID=UPI00384CD0AA
MSGVADGLHQPLHGDAPVVPHWRKDVAVDELAPDYQRQVRGLEAAHRFQSPHER